MRTIDDVLNDLRDKVGNVEVSNEIIKERAQLKREYNALFSAGLMKINEKSSIDDYERVDMNELPFYFLSNRYYTYKDKDNNKFLVSNRSPIQVTYTVLEIPNYKQEQVDELIGLQRITGSLDGLIKDKGQGGEILNAIAWLIVIASIIILFTEYIFTAFFIGIPAAVVFFVLAHHSRELNLISKHLD